MPQDEPEAAETLAQQLIDDGIDLRVNAVLERVEKASTGVRLIFGGGQVEADAVLVCVGRRPRLDGLCLDQANVVHGPGGIQVDRNLRTSQANIYAAGDCTGGFQFTHYAGYQGFMAVRNAFLPFNQKAVMDNVPWATFTDPEVAHAGLTESLARERHGDKVLAATWPMDQTDRWLTEGDSPGFLKLVYLPNGKLLGVTIVASRAGEMVQEWALALDRGLKLAHIAESLHIYPTLSLASQQLASKLRVDQLLSGTVGKMMRGYARMVG